MSAMAPAGRKVDGRAKADRIESVGELGPLRAESVVDGGGLMLAPGFIDPQNHSSTLDLNAAFGSQVRKASRRSSWGRTVARPSPT